MIRGRGGASRADVLRLFEGGSVVGLGDGELLERFAVARDEAAFEALVAKLGPMVLGVCRRMLADPHDVDDAFQATFLVLVRRARSIRDRDLVAAWLHGVATRVARRARAESIRRATRERVSLTVEPEARDEPTGLASEWSELRGLIDEEIERLPEHHRRLVVLCDVEGLSREEAALRLGWSLNMVRGRLERARDRLRGRLTRLGLTPSGGYLALLAGSPNLSPGLLAMTCRAALSFGVGRMGLGVATASVVALSEGVLKMMLLSKLKVGLAIVLSTGFVAAGTGLLAAQRPGVEAKQDPAKPAAVPEPPLEHTPPPPLQDIAKVDNTFQPRPAAELAKARIEAARQRLDAQKAFYEEGRITIDRFMDAARGVMQAELDATDVKAKRIEIVRSYHALLKEILGREEAELTVGRATKADVSEARTKLLDAEFLLARELAAPEAKPAEIKATAVPRPSTNPPPTASQALNRAKNAAKNSELARRLYLTPQEIGILDVLFAERDAMEDELVVATTKAERVAVIARHLVELKKLLSQVKTLQMKGTKTLLDVDRLNLAIQRVETQLIVVSDAPEGPGQGIAPDPAASAAPKAPNLPPDRPASTSARARLAKERVEIYQHVYQDALKSIGGYGIDPVLKASKDVSVVEFSIAKTKADQKAAAQAQIDRLKAILLASEKAGKNMGFPMDVSEVRLQLNDAEMLLLDIDDPGVGGITEPGAASVPGPGPSGATKGADPSPLAKAIEAFNAESLKDEDGRNQPPLTEEEVVAAIRVWKPASGKVISKELAETLESISEGKRWPEGSNLAGLTQKLNGKPFLFRGWWVILQVPGMEDQQSIMIRERLLRSVTYEEALTKAEAILKASASPQERSRLEKEIASLKESILKRDSQPK